MLPAQVCRPLYRTTTPSLIRLARSAPDALEEAVLLGEPVEAVVALTPGKSLGRVVFSGYGCGLTSLGRNRRSHTPGDVSIQWCIRGWVAKYLVFTSVATILHAVVSPCFAYTSYWEHLPHRPDEVSNSSQISPLVALTSPTDSCTDP
jgi:hypothetical protein